LLICQLAVLVRNEIIRKTLKPRLFTNSHLPTVLTNDRCLNDCDKGGETIGLFDPNTRGPVLDQAFPNRVFCRAGLPLKLPLGWGPFLQILIGFEPRIDEFLIVLVKLIVLVHEILLPVRHVGCRLPLEIGDPDGEADDLHVDSVVEIVPGLEDFLLMLGDPIGWIRILLKDGIDRVVGFLHEFWEFDLQWLVGVLGVVDAKNVDPLADLRNAKLIRAENPRFGLEPIAKVMERLADDMEGVPAVVRDQVADVLEHDVFRVLRLQDAGHLEEKGAPCLIVEPQLLPGLGKSLAGKASAENVVIGDVLVFDVADVVAGIHPIVGLVDLDAFLVDVRGKDAPAAERGESLMESADAAKEIYEREIFVDWHGFIL